MSQAGPTTRPRILMVTRLFPSARLPVFGTFCAERARALSQYADVRVIVPTPLCPPGLRVGAWARWSQVEREGVTAEGCPVSYPRFAVVPKTGTWIQGVTMARSVVREYRRRHGDWAPDLVDGHFAFPDGYAAVKLARHLAAPSVVTCHGSDLLKYPSIPIAGRMLRRTLRGADRVVGVSPALRTRAVELGCPDDNALFLSNGVDTARFAPQDRADCRKRLDLPAHGRIAICIGHLDDNKNQAVLIDALACLQGKGLEAPHLVLVGDGANRRRLAELARAKGVADSVHLAGSQPYDDIPLWLGAADWLVLASVNEGWPTVYFEAMACGRPVITSNVAAASECVCDERYGIIVPENTPEAFAGAMQAADRGPFDSDAIRHWAEQHSWDRWALRFLEIVDEIRHPGRAARQR